MRGGGICDAEPLACLGKEAVVNHPYVGEFYYICHLCVMDTRMVDY